MQANIILINAETDGAVPIQCNLRNIGSKLQLEYGGTKGWRIQIPIDTIRSIIDDELHG